ncbi:hypothetical protein BV372_24465 [Nostoc sp. T09]|uniref:tetratricopeptide repeat protein n=1 Tax=Nostoc sp. T09 TaxID=1932621 RepID=UPI000B63CCD0|nr:tetratricopeptide repeat protein [Nostoc sp. T09]OUL28700.1 hypothetical protein BV372_24465 [Nostoc sp. T09]
MGVAAAFELSWRRLRENAQHLGCLLSLFALAPIPWELVEGITINNEAQDWKKARRDLLQLHLLQPKGKGIYQLHPLLREFFQGKLTGLEQAEDFKRSFCRVMVAVAKNMPDAPTLQQIQDVAPAIPHLAEVANNLIKYISDKDLILPFCSLGRFYECQGLYEQAETWRKQCLDFAQNYFGLEHPQVAISINNMALLYDEQGRYDEAELLYYQALEIYQNLQEEDDHYTIATILNNLALLYNEQDRYTDAEFLFKQALEKLQRLPGKEHYQALCLINLGLLYKYQKNYKKAENLYYQALKVMQGLWGEEHPDIALCLNNLACLYDCQGNYKEAKLLHDQTLAMRQRLLGDEHLDAADSLNNLGLHYYSQGQYKEAEPLFLKALQIREYRLGLSHPDTVDTIENLADLRDRLNS